MNQQPSERGGFQLRPRIQRTGSACSLVDTSIEAYALGILDATQQAVIEQHLTRCSRCSELVASYQKTTALLALSVPLALPSPRSKTSLMARIADLPQAFDPLPDSAVFTGNLDDLRTPTLPASTYPRSTTDTPATPAAWWRIYAAPLATLPLILALGLVAAWGFNNYAELRDSQAALGQRDMQIARLSSQLSNDNSQGVANLMVSPSSKRYTLTSQATGGGDLARGLLIADSLSGQAAVQVSGLPAGTYAVIVQTQNGTMTSKAEFEVGTQGSATTLLDLGTQITDFDSVHIRPTTATTQTDVASIASQADVLMTTIGPDISTDSDTSVQNP